MDIVIGFIAGVVLMTILGLVIASARAGSVGLAFWGMGIAGRTKVDADLRHKIDALVGVATSTAAPATKTPTSKKPSPEPLRILRLLQDEARLIDFLMEDISGVSDDAQIGQAVRDIHRKAQAVLKEHLTIETVLGTAEGEQATVSHGFDPSAVRVVGNVVGEPPFTGIVEHPGWTVSNLKLPPLGQGQDPYVLQPAEVNLP